MKSALLKVAATVATVAAGTALAGPANAATGPTPVPAGGHSATAPMRAATRHATAVQPDGVGTTQGDCGLSILWVSAASKAFSIDLISYDGDITGGWYVIYTNGIGELTQSGGFTLDGTSAYTDGVIWDPGLIPNQAVAYGIANTIEGPCAFYVVAPWN